MVILEGGEAVETISEGLMPPLAALKDCSLHAFEPPGTHPAQKKAEKRRRELYYLHEVCFMHRGRASLGSMEATMNGLIYIVGLIVVVMVVLSFLGLR